MFCVDYDFSGHRQRAVRVRVDKVDKVDRREDRQTVSKKKKVGFEDLERSVVRSDVHRISFSSNHFLA